MKAARARRLTDSPLTLALAVAVPLVLAYLIWEPPAGDLAAATYRSELFARVGFTTWDTGWYAAHGYWLPSYSLLSPALGALLGVRLLLALSALSACALFALIASRLLRTAAARVAAVVFALGFCVGMLSGRVPYDVGFAIGLAAVLALMRGALPLALALAVLTGLASPVAGAFLGLAGLALALGDLRGVNISKNAMPPPRARGIPLFGHTAGGETRQDETRPEGPRPKKPRPKKPRPEGPRPEGPRPKGPGDRKGSGTQWQARGLALCAAALIPVLALSLAYPNGGYEPFAASAFWPALAGVLLIALLLPQGSLSPHGRQVLRIGAALYALALIGAYAIHTPMGGNAARLGPLLAAPLLAGILWERQRVVLLALAPLLLYWQLATPIRDYTSIAGDPSVHLSYYAPLLAELRHLQAGRKQGSSDASTIVEVPMTAAHWESAYLAGHDGVKLARGWERQLDTRYAAIFYGKQLTPAAYRVWLAENRVQYVALADAPLDKAGSLEGKLIAQGLPYLRELWQAQHWRLYRVMG